MGKLVRKRPFKVLAASRLTVKMLLVLYYFFTSGSTFALNVEEYAALALISASAL